MKSLEMLFLSWAMLTLVHLQLDGQTPLIDIDAVGIGIQVNSNGGTAMSINDAGVFGIYMGTTGSSGIYMGHAGHDGLHILNAGRNGIYVAEATGHSLNIQGQKSTSTLAGHMGLIKNKSTLSSPDVLALQVGTSNPAEGCNFLSFYNGSSNLLGEVQGNGSGGISYVSRGSDYAEYLPIRDHTESFSPGDVVGVYRGYISKETTHADHVMVITDQAAVVGNRPAISGDDAEGIPGFEKVSFLGQIRTNVQGQVQAGDWIVASGNGDGIAVALGTDEIELHHKLVGRAWESSSDPGLNRINTAVGLDHTKAYLQMIGRLRQENRNLQSQITCIYQILLELMEKQDDGFTVDKLENTGR